MKIQFTRSIIHAILDGTLAKIATKPDPVFGLGIPEQCPGVPAQVLVPRNTWRDGAAFDAKAKELARSFVKNFEQFAASVDREVLAAAPPLP